MFEPNSGSGKKSKTDVGGGIGRKSATYKDVKFPLGALGQTVRRTGKKGPRHREETLGLPKTSRFGIEDRAQAGSPGIPAKKASEKKH